MLTFLCLVMFMLYNRVFVSKSLLKHIAVTFNASNERLSLPLPRRICFRRCLSVCQQLCAKTSKQICMKFSRKVGKGPMNKRLNFGGDPDHRLDYKDCFPDSSLLGDTESGQRT